MRITQVAGSHLRKEQLQDTRLSIPTTRFATHVCTHTRKHGTAFTVLIANMQLATKKLGSLWADALCWLWPDGVEGKRCMMHNQCNPGMEATGVGKTCGRPLNVNTAELWFCTAMAYLAGGATAPLWLKQLHQMD